MFKSIILKILLFFAPWLERKNKEFQNLCKMKHFKQMDFTHHAQTDLNKKSSAKKKTFKILK